MFGAPRPLKYSIPPDRRKSRWLYDILTRFVLRFVLLLSMANPFNEFCTDEYFTYCTAFGPLEFSLASWISEIS